MILITNMRDKTLHDLKEKGLISPETFERLDSENRLQAFSIHWHVRTLLYLGLSLLATGLGILIYKNIDTIGHLTILILIGLTSTFCIFYTFKKAPAFQRTFIKPNNVWLDYIFLFGVLCFLSFEGYLQFQYHIFGVRYGLATFIPSVMVLALAYRFDHLGVLNIGLTLFASWLGISLSLQTILLENDFNTDALIRSGLVLSILFAFAGWTGRRQNFKAHFEFSYYHYAIHLAGVSLISASSVWPWYGIWLLPLGVFFYLIYQYSLRTKSFYLVVLGSIYTYVILSIIIFRLALANENSVDIFGLLMYYFIASGIAFIYLINKMRKQIKNL